MSVTYAIQTRGGSLIAGGFLTFAEVLRSFQSYREDGGARIVRITETPIYEADRHTGSLKALMQVANDGR